LPRMCPFATGVPSKRVVGKGVPRDCQQDQCEWWTGTEYAVLTIAKTLEKNEVSWIAFLI
jgi:hypothetical protein